MGSQPQNPEFRNNPENFHPWMSSQSNHYWQTKRNARCISYVERKIVNIFLPISFSIHFGCPKYMR